jgi:hypothetical protein
LLNYVVVLVVWSSVPPATEEIVAYGARVRFPPAGKGRL